MTNYAQAQWVLLGRVVAACKRCLATALEQAPRSTERSWVQQGYDAYMREHARGAS